MKSFVILIILFSVASCDPYGFGFKKNPAFVLDEAFKAIKNQDTETFLEMTGKEALCTYGSPEGLAYLKEHVTLSLENIKLKPTVLENRYFINPKFVGYWSYYHERYQIDIQDKITSEVLLKVIVDCEYGTVGEKSEKLINLKPKKYNMNECRVVKVVPKSFQELPVTQRCETLRVTL